MNCGGRHVCGDVGMFEVMMGSHVAGCVEQNVAGFQLSAKKALQHNICARAYFFIGIFLVDRPVFKSVGRIK